MIADVPYSFTEFRDKERRASLSRTPRFAFLLTYCHTASNRSRHRNLLRSGGECTPRAQRTLRLLALWCVRVKLETLPFAIRVVGSTLTRNGHRSGPVSGALQPCSDIRLFVHKRLYVYLLVSLIKCSTVPPGFQ